MTIAGVILAAGRGRRFGGDKLLARLADGSSVIGQTVQRMAAAVDEMVCVVRADDVALQQHLHQLQIPWLAIADADEGMSRSLQAGIRHFPNADAWLIALGDMPWVETETVRQLCQRWQEEQGETAAPGWIAVPVVCTDGTQEWQRGNPVLFGRQWGPALAALTGDVGGKSLLQGHPARVLLVAVTDPNILRDIDTPEDLGSERSQP